MRGNQAACSDFCDAPRSIPAYAGEPAQEVRANPDDAVYPRVCGGTSARPSCGNPGTGLSPRMRGNLGWDVLRDERGGSIPAYAGEPHYASRTAPVRQVYPRVCGGTATIVKPPARAGGLSPRMRGNRVDDWRHYA